MKIRLEKFISSQNFGTRSEVKKIIKSGGIFVDNKIQKDGSIKIDPLINRVSINNILIEYHEFIYIALNKPKNYVCATKDNVNLTVIDLIDKYKNMKLHIVGRLDKDTTGLVLLTNNGNWSHKLKSPNSNTNKEYEVTLKKPLDDLMIKKLKSQLILDKKVLKPIMIIKIKLNHCNVILTEGKFHQVKRMFKLVGNEVIELNRISIGEYKLKDFNIPLGNWKEFIL